MSKKIIKTKNAPQPIGPYNQAVVIGNLIYTSGQIPIEIATNQLISGGVSDQTRLVIKYLQAILEGAGSSLSKIVKCTVFLKNMNDFAEMNKVYTEFFPADSAPARSTIEVARLPKDVLVEIEAVASI